MMQPQSIREMIEAGLPGAQADVFGDDGTHFEARVIAEQFDGQGTLARHRAVYATLGERMGNDIHALSLKTFTPAEWAERQAS